MAEREGGMTESRRARWQLLGVVETGEGWQRAGVLDGDSQGPNQEVGVVRNHIGGSKDPMSQMGVLMVGYQTWDGVPDKG